MLDQKKAFKGFVTNRKLHGGSLEIVPLKTEFDKVKLFKSHSYMPSPLAPDPIRVQSCVCCLF